MTTNSCDSISSIITPSNLLYTIWNEQDYMSGYHQQDAHEFLLAFLDGLDKHLKVYHHNNHQQNNGNSEMNDASCNNNLIYKNNIIINRADSSIAQVSTSSLTIWSL